MNLLELRTFVVKNSGRYDLVIDSAAYADNGMNFYINEAIQMLDRMLGVGETKAKLYLPLASGEFSLTFQHRCRLITSIWVNNQESRWELTKYELDEFKKYFNTPVTSTDINKIQSFALADLRALETTDRDSLGTFINLNHDETDTNYDYRGILIGPPAEEDYIVEVNGFFKQATLADDADENYWTVEEPGLLSRATMYKLEAFGRGTENAKNWLSAIRDDVKLIDYDIAEEESYGINQMRG